MKRIGFLLLAVATVAGIVAVTPRAFGQSDGESSPIYGVRIPAGFRDWKVIAVDQLLVPGKADQLRAQLGNEIAFKAFREGKGRSPTQTVRLLPRFIGIGSRRKTTTKSWLVHSPARNLSWSAPA